MVFKGYDGNDWFRNLTDRPTRAYGGAGADEFHTGDDGFWDIDKDRVKDWEFGEKIHERDFRSILPGLGGFDPFGSLIRLPFGHHYEQE